MSNPKMQGRIPYPPTRFRRAQRRGRIVMRPCGLYIQIQVKE